MNRRRFSLNAVASSDGTHLRVSHDRRANTTGRTDYTFCGKEVIITNDSVYAKSTGRWLGYLYVDEHGIKYVFGPQNKGQLYKA